jgi:HlyD family secretion protein
MRYKILLPILSVLAFAFAVKHVIATGQEPPKQPPNVEPSRTPFKGALAGAGVIEPKSENIAIGSDLPGVVAEVFVKVGDPVAEGQKLFRLDDRHLRAELRVRQAMLDSAKASLAKLKSMPRPEEIPINVARVNEMKALLDDAREQFQRADKGYRTGAVTEDEFSKRKNAVATSQAQLDKAEAELKLLKQGAWASDLLVAEAQIELASAQMKQTETEIARLTVCANVSGKVLQKNLRPGEYVGIPPGQNLMVIGDVSTLHVRMDIDENDIGRFRPSLKGKAFTRGANKRQFDVRFVRVEPSVIPKKALTGGGTERVDTRVLQVIYAIDKQDDKLYVGQQMDVYLDAAIEATGATP